MGVKRMLPHDTEASAVKIHCTKSELQLFEPVAEQSSVLEDQFIEISPYAPVANNGPIHFEIDASEDFYSDLYQSYFKVTTKIVKSDDTDIKGETNKVAPVNAYLTSQFSKVSLSVQGVRVGSDTNLHPYIAYVTQLLNYSADGKKTHLEKQAIWLRDVGTDVGSASFDENLALKTRQAPFKGGGSYTMYGKMALDFANQPKLIPNRTRMTITMERADDSFVLMTDENEKYRSKITDCVLLLRRVRLNPNVIQTIESRLSNKPAQYPFCRIDARSFTIPMGTKQWKAQNLFSGFLPSRVIYGVVPQENASGTMDTNPFVFGNHGISYVNFYSDYHSTMVRPLEPDFDSDSYMDCYWALIRAMRKQGSDMPLDVEWREFKKLSCLFAQDLSPDPAAASRVGSFSIETKFKKSTTDTLTGIVIAEFKSCMILNKNREVSVFDY